MALTASTSGHYDLFALFIPPVTLEAPMYGNQLAKTGLGVSLFGTYLGEWQLVLITVACVVAGALLVRASRPFRKDAR
jgi:hypothetical protein